MSHLADLLGLNDTKWMDNPNRPCASPTYATPKEIQAHADNWFSTQGEAQCDTAKALCAGCPVWMECLAWALPQTDLHGIWGGTSAIQRTNARRKRRNSQLTREDAA